MTTTRLEELKAELNHRKNRYYFALRNYGESYDHLDKQHPEADHERLERVYAKYLEAKENYLKALDEFIDNTPMTEYTSL